MNKIIFLLLIWVCNSTQIFCQSLTDAQKYFDESRMIEAKQQIDEYVTTSGTDVTGLLLKSKIYYTLGSSKQYAEVVADGKAIAITALKTANSIDNKTVFTSLQQESFGLPINLHNDLSNDGIVYFNSATERKDKNLYEQALTQFKKAIAFSNYIFEQGWGVQALDSNNLLYAAKAAIYANKNEDALLYAKKIADNNIAKAIDNKGFQPVYEWLAYYYRQTKNEEQLLKYSSIGNAAFPSSPYFLLNKIDWYRDNKKYNNLVEEYNSLFKTGHKTLTYYNNYFNDLFNIIFAEKDSALNKQYFKTLFEKVVSDYTKKNKTAFTALLLAGKYYHNLSIEYAKNKVAKSVIDLCKTLSKKYLTQIVNNKLAKKEKAVYEEAWGLMR